MFYVLLIVIAAVATAAMTKDFPPTRTRIGVVSVAIGVVAVTLGITTGIPPAFYGGSSLLVYGLLMLLARVAAGVHGGNGPRFPGRS